MLKALAHDKDGRPMVIFGLSNGNLDRLREGKPILVDLAKFGLDGRIVIFWGTTEEAMAKDLEKFVTVPS